MTVGEHRSDKSKWRYYYIGKTIAKSFIYRDVSAYYIMINFCLHGKQDSISLSVVTVEWGEFCIKHLLQKNIVNYSKETNVYSKVQK